jgi:hypothetical protein
MTIIRVTVKEIVIATTGPTCDPMLRRTLAGRRERVERRESLWARSRIVGLSIGASSESKD